MPPKRPRPPHSTESSVAAPSKELTHRLLARFYRHVQLLVDLLPDGGSRWNEDDPPGLRELVEGVVIVSNGEEPLKSLAVNESGAGTVSMAEIVEQVQQRIFAAHARVFQREKLAGRPAFATPKNVLALGLRLTTDRTRDKSQNKQSRGPSIASVFPNTVVASLTSSPAWNGLTNRIGPDPLVELLSNPLVAMFTSLPNACYLQVSGVPVADLKLIEEHYTAKSTSSSRRTHQRAKRKRRRCARGHEEALKPAEDQPVEEDDPADAMEVDEPIAETQPAVEPMPTVEVQVASPSPTKRFLRQTLSAPSLFPTGNQPFSQARPTPQALSQLSPTKSGRLPLRATQSLASIAETDSTSLRPAKRRKLLTLNPPNSIVFSRQRMYHNRLVKHKGGRYPYGFPVKHILARLPSLFPLLTRSAADNALLDTVHAEAPARHLAKYIFPRQFGLHNPFTFPKPRSSFEVIPDYLDRELDIKKHGSIKTPTRLKPALNLLSKLAVLSQRCNYRKTLDSSCPTKITHKRLDFSQKSLLLDIVAEPNTQLSRSNVSIDVSNASLVLPHGQSQAEGYVQNKPKLAEYACPVHEVDAFVQRVVEQVIPRAFWGSTSNAKLVQKHISSFVRLRRYESTSLHTLLQGFSILECEWLVPPSASHKSNKQQKPNALDMEKRRELLSDFLFWLIDGFVIDLIRTAFYVTDAATHQNRPLYFRQDDWNVLTAPLLDTLGTSVFEKVPPNELISLQNKRELGYSYVRLLPKEAGVRPIVNLARRPLKIGLNGQKEVGQPINKVLQSVFDVLTFEKQRKPYLVGAHVSDPQQIFGKLKAYKERLQANSGGAGLPRLYFVKVDVQACYDTIQQDKLLQIVEEVLSETVYWIQKYSQVTPNGQYAARLFKRKACPDDDLGVFEELAQALAEELHNAVLSDQVVYTSVVRDKLMQLLREHITTNLVKVGGRLFRQKHGIPQGSVLSSLLCSLFYGDMERQTLGFTNDPNSALLRYVDDFLFISTSQGLASRFLRVMDDGIPEYGCSISAEKRLTNFDITLDDGEVVPPLPAGEDFPWCGLAINTRTLDIQFSAQGQTDKEIADQLTIQRSRRPGQAFINAMFRAVKIRSHSMYSDTSYNSSATAFINAYRSMLVVALKFQAYVQEWGIDPRRKSAFLLKALQRTVSAAYASLMHRSRARKARLLKVEFTLKQPWVTWLSFYAFHRVLSRRPSVYASLLNWLAHELKRPAYSVARLHLTGVVRGEKTAFADRTNAVRKVRTG
ncbi:hypothetical protein JCM10207_002715 [Rhodosporidiobolus poonsookiae]